MNAAGISLKSTIVLSTTAMLMAAPLMAAADSGTPQIKSFAFTKTLPKAPVDPLGVNDYSRLPNIGPGTSSGALSINLGFEGTSDYDTRALGIGVIPPDTMGAVGTTQYVQLINGSFTVYNKSDGSLAAPRQTDSSWWTSLGGTTTGGDPRVMFDPVTSRWLALGFDDTLGGVNLGVSATDNALGAWNVTTLSINAGGIADYPTLSISGNSVVIGTNNFSSGGGYQGTSLVLLPKADVFGAGGPVVTGAQTFNTPYPGTFEDRGFAIQGVNTQSTSGPVNVVAASAYAFDAMTYRVTGAGTPGVAQTSQVYLSTTGGSVYDGNSAARQPTTNGSARVVDALDDRVSASAWEVDGRIYFVHAITPTGTDNTAIRIVVLDAATQAVLSETDINDPSGSFDFYQGSLAVNEFGQVVVGYNRSGDISTGAGEAGEGRISVFARSFNTNPDGTLTMTGDLLLKESLVDDYHNGSAEGADPVGRQRWGDYSAVSLDPADGQSFWVIGQFAREYNNEAGGHPGGSGFGRWGTWITELNVTAVPEPSTWLMMIVGFGAIGAAARRRRPAVA